MSTATRQTAAVAGLYLLTTVGYAVTARLGTWSFRRSWFAEAAVSASPPWYFMGQDLAVGPYAATMAIILTLIVVAGRRLAGPHVWAVLASVPVSFAGSLALAANVLLHSSGVSDPRAARSAWTTFDEYLASQAVAQNAGLAAGAILALLCLAQYVRALRAAGEEAA